MYRETNIGQPVWDYGVQCASGDRQKDQRHRFLVLRSRKDAHCIHCLPNTVSMAEEEQAAAAEVAAAAHADLTMLVEAVNHEARAEITMTFATGWEKT